MKNRKKKKSQKTRNKINFEVLRQNALESQCPTF